MLDNEKLLFDELYEKTKDCGRVQFVELLMTKERENKQLVESFTKYKKKITPIKMLQRLDVLEEENQELKKQLKEYKRLGFKHLNDKCNKLENQQKEFINYLEDEINEHKNKEPFIVVNICSSYDLNDIELKLLEEILQKYKEITRGKDEKEN